MIEDSQTQQLLEGELLENVSDFFKALGNGTRLQIIWCLSQGELKSSELAAILQMSPSAISHQLTLLKNLKLYLYDVKEKIRFMLWLISISVRF